MINYKEARAGNIVMYDNRLFQIESIARSFPCLNTDEFGIGVVDWNNIQPIVLSPEILEKCGFEKGSIYFYFSKFRIVKINDSNNWLILLSDTYHHLCKLKHLHQLQNLYFALTGEELNYTP